MSETLSVFDNTERETYEVIDAVLEELDLQERHQGYAALRAVLHALRDRLPPVSAVHLSAQMPMLLRGVYFEGWKLSDSPTREHSAQDFVARVEKKLSPRFPMNADKVTRGVLAVLWKRMDVGEIDNAIAALPDPIKRLWPDEFESEY